MSIYVVAKMVSLSGDYVVGLNVSINNEIFVRRDISNLKTIVTSSIEPTKRHLSGLLYLKEYAIALNTLMHSTYGC